MTEDDWLSLSFEISRSFTGTPIRESDLFAGRALEISRMLKATMNIGRHVVLYGDRGVGKTSLSNIFWKRFNAGLQSFVVGKVQARPDDDFDSLWRRGLEELSGSLKLKGAATELGLSIDDSRVTPSQVRRELEQINPNLLPIVIIDEYNEIEDAQSRRLMANLIKELYDFSVPVTLILVGVAENIGTLLEDHKSVDRALTQIPLLRMSEEELSEIIGNGVSGTPLAFADSARHAVVNLSRGLPFFTQTLSRYAAQEAIEARQLVVTTRHVEAALGEFIEDSGESFKEAYREATRSNQANYFKESLLACALAPTDENGFFTMNDVVKPFSGIMRNQKRIAHFDKHLRRFSSPEGGSVLTARGGDRQRIFRFSDPMMQPYVIIRGIQNRTIDDGAKAALFPGSGDR